MRALRIHAPAWLGLAARALLALALLITLVTPGPALATNEIAKTEGLACTACHDKPGSKLLTDKGKYYELMGSFEGYDTVIEVFGSCTTCHVKKPGSHKLTREGRKFAEVMENMEAFRTWVKASHPLMAMSPVEMQEMKQEMAPEGDEPPPPEN